MKKIMSIVLLALLLVSIVSAVHAKEGFGSFRLNPKTSRTSAVLTEEKIDELREQIPQTYKLAQESMSDAPQLIYTRFLMWTDDGRHIMWGTRANGYFVGHDNLGKTAWGIYNTKIFAGFYDGEFFYGRYSRGRWVAYGLFGLEKSGGIFVLFPQRSILPLAINN